MALSAAWSWERAAAKGPYPRGFGALPVRALPLRRPNQTPSSLSPEDEREGGQSPWQELRRGTAYQAPNSREAMPLRYMRPLDEESWNRVVAALKRGPTPKQVEMKKRLLEIASEIKSDDDSSEWAQARRRP